MLTIVLFMIFQLKTPFLLRTRLLLVYEKTQSLLWLILTALISFSTWQLESFPFSLSSNVSLLFPSICRVHTAPVRVVSVCLNTGPKTYSPLLLRLHQGQLLPSSPVLQWDIAPLMTAVDNLLRAISCFRESEATCAVFSFLWLLWGWFGLCSCSH